MKEFEDITLTWVLNSAGFATAFCVGLWQYRRAQRQQKASLLVKLIEEFEIDEELRVACYLFDYDAGKFTLRGESYKFTNELLHKAMKVVKDDYEWPQPEEFMREVLDRFFDFFGKLDSFIDIGLLKFKDLNYFYYYFELLVQIEKYKGIVGFNEILKNYLNAYHFSGCEKCLEMYRRLPSSQRVELNLPDA